MNASSAAIDVTERAYDLSDPDGPWIEKLLSAALPIVDDRLGVAGVTYARRHGAVEVTGIHVASGSDDFAARKMRLMMEMPPAMQDAVTRPGAVGTLSEFTAGIAGATALFQRHMAPMADALGITAVDPDGQGLILIAGRRALGGLTNSTRYRFQQIAVHFAAGHRLRRALSHEAVSDLPFGGEALLDPLNWKLAEARGDLRTKSAGDRLREAAVLVDRARGRLRRSDPDQAMEIWRGLVDGRWSLVDWFDSDGRRFVIARPNAPTVDDPRGLTLRERQVVTYAALGESSKLISYRLGLAKSTVSGLLSSAKRKLGVRNQSQLVERLRPLATKPGGESPSGMD